MPYKNQYLYILVRTEIRKLSYSKTKNEIVEENFILVKFWYFHESVRKHVQQTVKGTTKVTLKIHETRSHMLFELHQTLKYNL